MGFRKKGQILRGQIQFIVNEPICPGNVVHHWRAADFAWLFFHFGPVIDVGIVALNHYRLQYHQSGINSIISVFMVLMAESINPEMCVKCLIVVLAPPVKDMRKMHLH